MKGKDLPELARDVQPWLRLSLAVMLASGFLLFISEAVKMYTNEAFQFKMLFLALALIFTFTVHPRFTRASQALPVGQDGRADFDGALGLCRAGRARNRLCLMRPIAVSVVFAGFYGFRLLYQCVFSSALYNVQVATIPLYHSIEILI